MKLLSLISKQSRIAIAEQHIQVFDNRVQAGRSGVLRINIEECERYRALWRDTKAQLEADRVLSRASEQELEDALYDGGSDERLTEEERAQVQAARDKEPTGEDDDGDEEVTAEPTFV